MSDELVKKAKNGDVDAFSSLIKKYQKDLYKIAKCRLRLEEDVCDAVQDTLISAYISISKLKNEKYFKTWLIKILINNCNDIYKKKNNNIIYFENIVFDTDECINEKNSNIDFYNLIDDLDIEERTILVLLYSETYKAKEIAKMLNLNYSTVRSKIKRAKAKLEKKLKEKEDKYGRIR